MASVALLRALHRREVHTASVSAFKSISTNGKMGRLARPFCSRPVGNDVIGIDSGTTDSCVEVMEGKTPGVIIVNAQGRRSTPVAINQKGEFLVGTAAKRHAVTNPTNTISMRKRPNFKLDIPAVVGLWVFDRYHRSYFRKKKDSEVNRSAGDDVEVEGADVEEDSAELVVTDQRPSEE